MRIEAIYTPMDCLEELGYMIHVQQPTARLVVLALDQIANKVGDIEDNISFIHDVIVELRPLDEGRSKELQRALSVAVLGHDEFNKYLDDMGV